MTPKRAKAEAQILKSIATADPSGFNTQRYKERFAAMSDKQFDDWMRDCHEGRDKFPLETPNMKVQITIRNLQKACDEIGVKLFEQLRIWDSSTKRYFTTPEKFLIVELPVRRVKQYLMDKISVPTSDRVVNPTTGQVVKPDKGSAISMTEAQTYDSKGLQICLDELLIVRGGNLDAYAQYKAALENGGSVRLSELDYSGGVRSAEIAKVLLESMHIENNLT